MPDMIEAAVRLLAAANPNQSQARWQRSLALPVAVVLDGELPSYARISETESTTEDGGKTWVLVALTVGSLVVASAVLRWDPPEPESVSDVVLEVIPLARLISISSSADSDPWFQVVQADTENPRLDLAPWTRHFEGRDDAFHLHEGAPLGSVHRDALATALRTLFARLGI